jgi:ribosome modulation factor
MARPKGSKNRKKQANGGEDGAVFDKSAAGANGAADEIPEAGHNSQAITDVIRDAAANIRELTVRRNALQEQAKKINQQIAAEFRRVKSVAGVDRKIMEEAIHRADLEPENYEKTFAQMRTAYHALGIGEVVDWIKATTEQVRQPAEEEVVTVKTARAAGRQTGQAGKSATLNPHAEGSDLRAAWDEGHLEGTADNLPAKGKSAPAVAPGDPFGPAETTH